MEVVGVRIRLNHARGASFVEIVLALVVSGVIAAAASHTMISNVDSYSHIANRRTTLSDVRHSFNEMARELRALNVAKIISIGTTSIAFVDSQGQNSAYRLDVTSTGLGLYRGDDLLYDRVSTLALSYYDGDSIEVPPQSQNIPRVKRIKISLVTQPVDGEGRMSVDAVVIPRDYIGYTSYGSK